MNFFLLFLTVYEAEDLLFLFIAASLIILFLLGLFLSGMYIIGKNVSSKNDSPQSIIGADKD